MEIQPEDDISFDHGEMIRENNEERPIEEDEELIEENNILCVIWKKGKLGAAYYNSFNSELFVVPDTVDISPYFYTLQNLLTQVQPVMIVTVGSLFDNFYNALAKILNASYTAETTISADVKSRICVLTKTEAGLDACRNTVCNIRLPNEPKDATHEERSHFLSSIIDFGNEVALHALGALCIYISKNWVQFFPDLPGAPQYTKISLTSSNDFVYVDHSTIESLSIFHKLDHPSVFKRGDMDSNKEGWSLYRLFNRCRTILGENMLREILLHPTNNMQELNMRLNLIEFCMDVAHTQVVQSIKKCLRHISNITVNLSRMEKRPNLSLYTWKKIYETITNVLVVRETCLPFSNSVQFFADMCSDIDTNLYACSTTVAKAIDFDNTKNQATVRFGLDETLDKKKRFRDELCPKLTAAAQCEMERLPSFITTCSIIYVPEIGYVLGINKWAEDSDPRVLEDGKHVFSFIAGDVYHYKTSICVELDSCYGDIHNEIRQHEMRILLRLTENILASKSDIKIALKHIAKLDCLMSLSEVSHELGYVQPVLREESQHIIINGRHPLLELRIPNYVPNDYCSGGEYGRIKIITGPNASGKSIYLKQVILIVYLAHVGCYVPAESATIGLLTSLHTSIKNDESIVCETSAFSGNLRHLSTAMFSASGSSLVILDEFGKGTSSTDGLSLLSAFLEELKYRKSRCPHVIISTHFQKLAQLNPLSELVQHLKFDHMIDGNRRLVYLHKLVNGVSRSLVHLVAESDDFPRQVLRRSIEILGQYLKNLKLV